MPAGLHEAVAQRDLAVGEMVQYDRRGHPGRVSGSACTGADFERSIRSSRRAFTFVVEEASLRADPQAPQNGASAGLGAPQTGQGLPSSSLIVNGLHPDHEPINVSTWVPPVRAFFPPRPSPRTVSSSRT